MAGVDGKGDLFLADAGDLPRCCWWGWGWGCCCECREDADRDRRDFTVRAMPLLIPLARVPSSRVLLPLRPLATTDDGVAIVAMDPLACTCCCCCCLLDFDLDTDTEVESARIMCAWGPLAAPLERDTRGLALRDRPRTNDDADVCEVVPP